MEEVLGGEGYSFVAEEGEMVEDFVVSLERKKERKNGERERFRICVGGKLRKGRKKERRVILLLILFDNLIN